MRSYLTLLCLAVLALAVGTGMANAKQGSKFRPAVSGKLGARVVGQVRTTDTSYHWIVKEVQIIGH